jgi:hypothetical protein
MSALVSGISSAILGGDFIMGNDLIRTAFSSMLGQWYCKSAFLIWWAFLLNTTAIISLDAYPGLTTRFWFWFPRIGCLIHVMRALGSCAQSHCECILLGSAFNYFPSQNTLIPFEIFHENQQTYHSYPMTDSENESKFSRERFQCNSYRNYCFSKFLLDISFYFYMYYYFYEQVRMTLTKGEKY